MKSLITRSLILLLISGSCISCKKDQSEVSPDFKFKSLQDGAVIWNSVNIELSVPDPATITKVEIALNSKLLFTLNQPPYSVTWDTHTVEDGAYELTATSSNQQGNHQVAKINATVQNTLLSLTVPNNHLFSSDGKVEKGWVFISSATGEVIASAELNNGAQIKLDNPTFNRSSFMLSEVYLSDSVSLDISSFQDVPRGGWTLAKVDQNPNIIGQLSISFQDSVGVHPYYVSTDGESKRFLQGGYSIMLNLTLSPSKLFIREIGKETNHYNLIAGLTLSDNYTGKFSQLTNPLQSVVSPTMTGAEIIGVRLYGFPSTTSFVESYELGEFSLNDGRVKIEYPGTDFPVYGSENIYEGNNIRINSFSPTKMYDIAPLKAQVIFADKGQASATLATSGDFDIYVVGWSYSTDIGGVSWILTGGSGKSEYLKLPELPSAIRNASVVTVNSSTLKFQGAIQVADYGIAKDYPSFIQYISKNGYNSPYVFGNAWKEQTFSASGITGEGRKQTSEIPTIKERLSRR